MRDTYWGARTGYYKHPSLWCDYCAACEGYSGLGRILLTHCCGTVTLAREVRVDLPRPVCFCRSRGCTAVLPEAMV